MKLLLAIWLGKLIDQLTRLLKIGGGSAAPGLYSLKVDPKLIKKLSRQIPQTVIITGTNGKTTTAKMISLICTNQNIKLIRNSTGSNLERGIASTLIRHSSLLGKIQDAELAIWEVDEAAFNLLAPILSPDLVVFLNVFRDQLDRYGEVDSVVSKWSTTLTQLPKSVQVILNGDDGSLQPLSKAHQVQIETFGLDKPLLKGERARTPRQIKNYLASNVQTQGLEMTQFDISFGGLKARVQLNVPGRYHVYDALASLVTAYKLNLSLAEAVKNLTNYQPAFGRVEKLIIKNHRVFILLIKNPAGASEVLKVVSENFAPTDSLVIALNDNLADGKDVSWIWDIDFSPFTLHPSPLRVRATDAHPSESRTFTLICSGTRAEEIALRLKYAGADPNSIKIEPELSKAFNLAFQNLRGTLYVLPTYTALLKLQKILAQKGIKEHYWQN